MHLFGFFPIYFSISAPGHTIASETCERQGFTTFPYTIIIHNWSKSNEHYKLLSIPQTQNPSFIYIQDKNI